jgi:hypothetical protein
MIRIRRLLATIATSAVLLFGAVIALEALGLLFQKARPDPEPVIVNANFREVPEDTAPAHLLKQLEEQERAKAEAEEARAKEAQAKEAVAKEELRRQEAADAAEAEARKLAEQRKLEAEKAARKVAALDPPPVIDAPPKAEVQPAPEAARNVKLAPSTEPEHGKHRLHLAPARRERARAVRRGNVHQARSRCPFLAWWETVVMGAPAPTRRAA